MALIFYGENGRQSFLGTVAYQRDSIFLPFSCAWFFLLIFTLLQEFDSYYALQPITFMRQDIGSLLLGLHSIASSQNECQSTL